MLLNTIQFANYLIDFARDLRERNKTYSTKEEALEAYSKALDEYNSKQNLINTSDFNTELSENILYVDQQGNWQRTRSKKLSKNAKKYLDLHKKEEIRDAAWDNNINEVYMNPDYIPDYKLDDGNPFRAQINELILKVNDGKMRKK